MPRTPLDNHHGISHLGGAHKRGATLFVAPCALNVFPREGAPLGALGVGGCNRLRLRCFWACGLASISSSFAS